MIRPIAVPEVVGEDVDLAALALFSAVMLPLSRSHGTRIVRWKGLGLVVAYLLHVVWWLGG